jgi:hypothetical protein
MNENKQSKSGWKSLGRTLRLRIKRCSRKGAKTLSMLRSMYLILSGWWRDRGIGVPNTWSGPLILGAKPPRRLPCPLKPGAIMKMGEAEALGADEGDEADFIVLTGRPCKTGPVKAIFAGMEHDMMVAANKTRNMVPMSHTASRNRGFSPLFLRSSVRNRFPGRMPRWDAWRRKNFWRKFNFFGANSKKFGANSFFLA